MHRPADDARVEELARAAAAGDSTALNDLLRAIEPQVLARCGRFLPNLRDAEEACQDTLLAVARRISSFEGRSKFTTWLYRVASNTSIDTYRKLKRRQSVLVDPPEQPRTAGGSPSVLAGARVDLLEAVEQIDPRIAEPVLLRDLCELDYSEIAAQLGAPEGTIRSRVHEGRAAFRRLLHS